MGKSQNSYERKEGSPKDLSFGLFWEIHAERGWEKVKRATLFFLSSCKEKLRFSFREKAL